MRSSCRKYLSWQSNYALAALRSKSKQYQSTREAGQALTDIRISGCTVHGVRGTHGICVYARNDLAPVQNLTIEDCVVYDCDCGDSESMVLNGNVDGFVIKNNVIHDNNNRRYNQ